jgi:dTDP-4-amino-4,6-dideoxygalactose transaminase
LVPRKKLDIGWLDLGYGLIQSLRNPAARDAITTRLAQAWSAQEPSKAMWVGLSVRTGLDALLHALALPKGSEVLMSAITIGDMVRIVEHHGLRAVPVDIDPETCALRTDMLEAAITPHSRLVLVAHLFGSRMPMTDIVTLARRHSLMVLEDCAQAFTADGYRGHPETDVAMFSFGPIKTATALGGAIFCMRDAALLAQLNQRTQSYPVQTQGFFRQRVAKYAGLKALSYRWPYTLLVTLTCLAGRSHDTLISGAVRGFSAGELINKIRYQPSVALIALLTRRIQHFTPANLAARIQAAQGLINVLPKHDVVGRQAAEHSHWVFPLQSEHADALVRHLWAHGFDASQKASSLYAVCATGEAQGTSSASAARRAIEQIVYLPTDAGASPKELRRLADVIRAFKPGTRDTSDQSCP